MTLVKRTLWTVLVLNLSVAVAKLGYGLLSSSVAMQADGFHSLFDGVSNIIGLAGIGLAARPADRDHPYGHGKYETYAAALIGGMLVLAAWRVGFAAVLRLMSQSLPPRVDAISFAVMLGTLAVNLSVTLYERRIGRRLRSEVLLADARHTASDVLVSLGVIGGLLAVRAGYPIADPILALAVAVAIVYAALGILRQANDTLSDRSRIPSVEIATVVRAIPGVLGCHSVRTRGGASEVYVDLHVQVNRVATVEEGHVIAEAVERAISGAFTAVVDVIAHLEPFDEYQYRKTAEQRDAGLA